MGHSLLPGLAVAALLLTPAPASRAADAPTMGGAKSDELGRLTALELARAADEAVDVAHGLGTHVTVMGLSMGGVMAGFVAQGRPDVERAVLR